MEGEADAEAWRCRSNGGISIRSHCLDELDELGESKKQIMVYFLCDSLAQRRHSLSRPTSRV